MSRYDIADIEQIVSVHADVTRALQKFAPHVADTKKVRLLSSLRATIVSVQDEVVVKYGYDIREVEADTMRFVARETRMPVPKVYGVYKSESGATFIVMEFMNGATMEKVWKTLSREGKKSMGLELRGYFRELRKLKEIYIGALGRLPCTSESLQGLYTGPFENERELNETFVKNYEHTVPGYFGSMLTGMLKDGHEIVFSHSDLNMRNILVRDKKIVAVLDWEYAGFFPEYWDYAHAYLGVRWNDEGMQDWVEFLQTSLDVYPVQAAIVGLLVTRMR